MVQHYSSSEFQGWQTPEAIIDLAVALAFSYTGESIIDLCGMSRYFPEGCTSLGGEANGISTFEMEEDVRGRPAFANPPYGRISPQCSLTPYDRRCGILGAVRGLTLSRDKQGIDHLTFERSSHSCGAFSSWMTWMYSQETITSGFLVVPSSTDTEWHRNLFEGSGAICVDLQRIPFEMTDEYGDNFIPKSGNTKGTSIFWYPPRQSRKESVRLLYEALYDAELPWKWVAKQPLVSY